jgi:hypothetical protein
MRPEMRIPETFVRPAEPKRLVLDAGDLAGDTGVNMIGLAPAGNLARAKVSAYLRLGRANTLSYFVGYPRLRDEVEIAVGQGGNPDALGFQLSQ